MSLWDQRLGRKLEDEDALDAVARMQDDAVDRAHLPLLPQDEDSIAAIARGQDAAVAGARLPRTPSDEPGSWMSPEMKAAAAQRRGQAASLQDVQGPEVTAWAKDHPGGLDLGSNEKQLAKLRAARDAVRGKRPTVDVGRPDMPTGGPRAFAEISPPGANSPVDSSMSQTKVAGEQVSADRPRGDPDMLAAELLASGRRTREAMNEGTRLIGYAGLQDASKRSATSADVAGNLDAPIKSVQADRAFAQKQREEGRAAEDQGFQRETQGFSREKMGFERTAQASKADRASPTSDISARRKAEAIGLYPKELGRIDPETWKRVTADDVDVLLKELNMQKDRSSARASAIETARWLSRRDALGKGSQGFGEIDAIQDHLEQLAPGVTSGKGIPEDALLGVGGKLAMSFGGAGEAAMSALGEGKAVEFNRALDDLAAQVGYMRSGKVVSEQERKGIREQFGLLPGQSAAAQARGIQRMFEEIHQRQRNFQEGYYDPRGAIGGVTPGQAFESGGGTSFHQSGHASEVGPRGGAQRRKGTDGHWYVNDGNGWQAE